MQLSTALLMANGDLPFALDAALDLNDDGSIPGKEDDKDPMKGGWALLKKLSGAWRKDGCPRLVLSASVAGLLVSTKAPPEGHELATLGAAFAYRLATGDAAGLRLAMEQEPHGRSFSGIRKRRAPRPRSRPRLLSPPGRPRARRSTPRTNRALQRQKQPTRSFYSALRLWSGRHLSCALPPRPRTPDRHRRSQSGATQVSPRSAISPPLPRRPWWRRIVAQPPCPDCDAAKQFTGDRCRRGSRSFAFSSRPVPRST